MNIGWEVPELFFFLPYLFFYAPELLFFSVLVLPFGDGLDG